MNLTINIWVILFTFGFVMSTFLASLFLVFRKRYSFNVYNISMTLFILSLMLLGEIAEESNFVDNNSFILGINAILDMLLWPFLLFYVQFITGNRVKNRWLKILYFLPFLLAITWQIPFLLLSNESKLAVFSNGIPKDVAFLVGYKMVFAITFLLYTIHLLNTKLIQLKSILIRNKKIEFLFKIKRFFISITLIVLLIYLMFFNQYFDVIYLGDSDRISSLIISALIYFLGLLIFKNPQLFFDEKYSKQIKYFFNGNEQKYAEKIIKIFNNEKIYLNEKLAVKDVAKKMELTNQQLSYMMNRQLGITFLDFVNTYRVKEIQKKIQQGNHQTKTLFGLALESGFNSKASFNRIFKDHTGFSPSAYAKSLKK